uniref:Rab-GAP TBC domain-containing protein n=1 Tax=Romanomermis culicivorax TaxID=13658 RepID=A0A915JZ52_ROMCU
DLAKAGYAHPTNFCFIPQPTGGLAKIANAIGYKSNSSRLMSDKNSTVNSLSHSLSSRTTYSDSSSTQIDMDAAKRRNCWRHSIFRKVTLAPYKIGDISVGGGKHFSNSTDQFFNGTFKLGSIQSSIPRLCGFTNLHIIHDDERFKHAELYKNYTEGNGDLTEEFGITSMPSTDHGFGSFPEKPANFYKLLWKKLIFTQISIIRLQKGPVQKTAERIRQMKLNYDEMPLACETEIRSNWSKILGQPRKYVLKNKRTKVEEAIRKGVPKYLREKVWPFLLLQYNISLDVVSIAEYHYYDLLKKDTPYVKDILVDLDRTFPEHAYFKQAQSRGQISLFNILKAYACYDTAVGYCQGMSFIAGLLLLH